MRARTGWRWFSYAPEDAKAAQAALNRLAEEGLELEEIWFCIAKFKRAEGERGPACWVEPARWTSMRVKDENRQAEYLEFCDEAGWELVDTSRGMFWFKAKPGMDPVPLQTDGGVEWDSVLRRALNNRIWDLIPLTLIWALYLWVRFARQGFHLWEMLLSNSAMLATPLLLVWLLIDLLRGVYVVGYRSRCRRAAEAGEPIPVPKDRGARLRGALGLVKGLTIAAALLCLLAGVGETQSSGGLGGLMRYETNSILVRHSEYYHYGSSLWLDMQVFDCRYSWLADIITTDLVADEGDEKWLDQRYHHHVPVTPTPTSLGFDQSWTYRAGEERIGLILRQGNRALRIETDADLTDPAALEELRAWLEENTY